MNNNNIKFPFITVVMPVRNESKYIENTILMIINQNYPKDKYEIIIADGESTDSTRRIIEELSITYPQIKLKTNPKLLSSAGRNIGFKNGNGDIFIVIDGHCVIGNNNLFNDIVKTISETGADCLGRPQPFVVDSEPTLQNAIALARKSKLGHSHNSLIYSDFEGFVSPISVGCVYTRNVFEKIGYVDESFDACEDVEFNYRVEKAGFKSYISPKFTVKYYPRNTIAGLRRQLIRYGQGRAKFILKHPEVIDIDMILTVLFSIGVFLGIFFSIINILFFWVYVIIMIIYFSIISYESIRLNKSFGFNFYIKLITVFFVIHTSSGIGIIKQLFISLFKKNKGLPLKSMD